MKAVVFYESAPDVASQAPAHMPAHRARWDEFSRRGELLMIGPFANAQDDGAMGVFTTRAAAEEFVRGDPFVLAGVVSKVTILDWNEALVPDTPGVLPGPGGRPVAAQETSNQPDPSDGGRLLELVRGSWKLSEAGLQVREPGAVPLPAAAALINPGPDHDDGP
jgi:uncharacterized protein